MKQLLYSRLLDMCVVIRTSLASHIQRTYVIRLLIKSASIRSASFLQTGKLVDFENANFCGGRKTGEPTKGALTDTPTRKYTA